MTTLSNKIDVLNLVINGYPSIHKKIVYDVDGVLYGFKPCYKWIPFNTLKEDIMFTVIVCIKVLNLVINGYPSILKRKIKRAKPIKLSFKPCYKWIPFNTCLY